MLYMYVEQGYLELSKNEGGRSSYRLTDKAKLMYNGSHTVGK